MPNNEHVNQKVGYSMTLSIDTTTNLVLHISFLRMRYAIQLSYCSIYSMDAYHGYSNNLILDGHVGTRIGHL